ncbi:MAG: hypothetical protein R3240_00225 [Gammaproteobacteria bacterium]|nr:hypothetical protein [Gammaproteobacteria bacterium]
MYTNTPWTGVFVVLLLQACSTSNDIPEMRQTLTAPVAYFNSLHNLDDPNNENALGLNNLAQKNPTNKLNPRFSNFDNSRLLATETNYFNNEIDSITVYDYNANQLTRVTWYSAPGPDGLWQTADDVVGSYHDHASPEPGVLYTLYRGPGADQTWFTTDDEILYYHKLFSDANGAVIGIATYTLAGDDGIWFTDDDFIGWINTETTTGNETRRAMYLGAGPDNDWRTLSDNSVYRFSISMLNILGQTERYSFYLDAGADTRPFTGDDIPIYYRNYQYDSQDRIKDVTVYGGAGVDNTWFTADDLVRSCKQQLRDTNDLPYRTLSTLPGTDLSCFTSDDITWGYHDDTFNADNLVSDAKSYFLPGIDKTWFTPDDVLIYARTYK